MSQFQISLQNPNLNMTSLILLPLLLKTHLISPSNLLLSPSNLNPIISSFSRSNFPLLALQTLSLLHHLSLPLDSYSLCSSLSAASSLPSSSSSSSHNPATQIHAAALKSGLLPSSIFVCGALIEFYARSKSRDIRLARNLFDEIPHKNLVCANSLLNGFVERRLWTGGIGFVRTVLTALRFEPDEVTLSGVLKICAEASLLGLGTQVHAFLLRRRRRDPILFSSLLEMYGKCGLVREAKRVFDGFGRKDVVLWTSMLTLYGRNGMFLDVIADFEEMLREKTAEPDELVFLSVLSACGRTGNVAKGTEFLEGMRRDFGLEPGPEHYGCFVDMLCKAGEMEGALRFVQEIEMEGDRRLGVGVWGAILSACRECGNVEVGEVAAKRALELDPYSGGIYMELSNLYAGVGMWEEIGRLRGVMEERGLKKSAGFSWVESANC